MAAEVVSEVLTGDSAAPLLALDALPAGATEANVTATYADGVLEVRVPIADEVPPASTKVPITRS